MSSSTEYTAAFHCELNANGMPIIYSMNTDAEKLTGQTAAGCIGKEVFQIHLFEYMLRHFLHELEMPTQDQKHILAMPIHFPYNQFDVTHFVLHQHSSKRFLAEIQFTEGTRNPTPVPSCTRAIIAPVFDNDLCGIVIFNPKGVCFANPGAGKVLRHATEDICQWNHAQLMDVVSDTDSQLVTTHIGDVMRLETPHAAFQCSIRSGNNEEKWINCFARRIRYERKPACLLTFCDNSLQKRFEQVHPHLVNDNSAVFTERQRIARILHDSAAQNLSLALMRLAMLRPRIQQSEEYELVMESYRLVMSCARQLRDLSHQLDHDSTENDNFLKVLNQTLAQLNRANGPHFSLIDRCPAGVRLPSNLRIAVSNCLGELFANICRHSESKNAVVIMEMVSDSLKIVVKDDGCGFYCDDASSFGFGLKHIQRRIESLGGKFLIQSSMGVGTRVEMIFPL